jgi:HPr kinase/phosphorylase
LSDRRELIHGTCVAFGKRAALLRGGSGTGKSDLALRFIALPPEGELKPRLVADDQVWVEALTLSELTASAPPTIAGKLEVRGLGIVEVPYVVSAQLVLAVDLIQPEDVPRMPPEPWEQIVIAGVSLPLLRLAAFEPSAALKLKLAFFLVAPDRGGAWS